MAMHVYNDTWKYKKYKYKYDRLPVYLHIYIYIYIGILQSIARKSEEGSTKNRLGAWAVNDIVLTIEWIGN